MSHLKFIMILCLSFTGVAFGQGAVVRPTWSQTPGSGGLPYEQQFIPPEYSGSFQGILKLQFPARSNLIAGELASLRFSPTSGVLAFKDNRDSKLHWSGWDTGFDRVYSVVQTRNSTATLECLCVVWDDLADKSKLIRLTLNPTGDLQQTLLSVESVSNQVWVAASLIESEIYLAEMQSMTLQRIVDSDADGIPDVLDATFSVGLPTELVAAQLGSPSALECFPIGSLFRRQDEIVSVSKSGAAIGNIDLSVTLEDGIFELGRHEALPRKALSLYRSPLCPTQKRICVAGWEGMHFSIEARKPDGSILVLASDQQIQANNLCVVELSEGLEADWEVRALALAVGEESSSPWKPVDDVTFVVLFEERQKSVDPVAGVYLLGDGFPPGLKGRFRPKGGSDQDCTVVRLDAGKIHVKFPILGSGSGSPPFSRMTQVSFWLVDEVTGERISNCIKVWVRHN